MFRRWVLIAGFLVLALPGSDVRAAVVTWTGAGDVGSPRSWDLPADWGSGAVPGANDDNTFGILGDGTILLDDAQFAHSLTFENFTTTVIDPNGNGNTLTLTTNSSLKDPIISVGEGVRHTYGCDYFTAGRLIEADVSLDGPLTIKMGQVNDSALMFSGQISATNPAYGITIVNAVTTTSPPLSRYQGNSVWITSNNTFAGPVSIISGSNQVRWGTALKLADAGRLDTAPITLDGDLAALSLLTLSGGTTAAYYSNTITSVSGSANSLVGSSARLCPVIHADRSYQTNLYATAIGQTVRINDVILDNPMVGNDSNGRPYDSAIAFGSDTPYLRTNNQYTIQGRTLILGDLAPHNPKNVYVNNGNFTTGLAGNRYLGGVNDMNISMNEARFVGDSVNGVPGLIDHEQDLNKYGPGVLEIGGDNRTKLSDGSTPSSGDKYIWQGVLRFAEFKSKGAGAIIIKSASAGVGVGWDGVPPTITVNIPGGSLPGASGALDIDVANYTSDLNFMTNANISGLRLGSSSRGVTASVTTSTLTPSFAANGSLWYLLGGGGGTLTIHSNLNDVAGLEMATTGTLLPGRVIIDPNGATPNFFGGPTMIYAGTLQPTKDDSLKNSPSVSVNTTCTDFDGTYLAPLKTSLAGTPFTFAGPGQLLLDPKANYSILSTKIALDGGAVGWTGSKTIYSITGDVGSYGQPLNSYLWWREDMGTSPPLASILTSILHLGGEYSAGIMVMKAPIADGANPVALVKSGIYSKLDLSNGTFAGNSYTGGTSIIGGELIVSNANQVAGDPGANFPRGGPILIANGGTLRVTASTTFTNALKFITKGTPDTTVSIFPGGTRMSSLFNGSVIQVDGPTTQATMYGLLDGRPPQGMSPLYTITSPFEKTGTGTLYLDYHVETTTGSGVWGASKQYPCVNVDANHWGIKLTEGLVSTNQLPYVLTNSSGVGERSNGYIVCNGGDLEVRTPPTGFDFHQDKDPGITGSSQYWVYGFGGFNSFEGTTSTITVQDSSRNPANGGVVGLFRVSSMSPNIIMGTVVFQAAAGSDTDDTNNVFHLRMAADTNHNVEEGLPPGGDSRGTGTLDLRSGMVVLTTREDKLVLPSEAGFTLKLNGGIFNGMQAARLNGNLIINEQSASGTPKIDGEEQNEDWQVPLLPGTTPTSPGTWVIAGTGKTEWHGTLEKIGPGYVVINREEGAAVTVDNAGATFKISGGTVDVGGTGDPFTDTSNPHLAVAILNNFPATLNITAGVKHVDSVNGTGTTNTLVGATLNVGSLGTITQNYFNVFGTASARDAINILYETCVGDGIHPASLSTLTSLTTGTLVVRPGGSVSAGSITITGNVPVSLPPGGAIHAGSMNVTTPLSISGSLQVDDTLTASAVTVGNGGSLGGHGTIDASVEVLSGASLAPGNSPGTLSIVGDLLLKGGALYDWEVSATASDLVNVDGNLTFDGAPALNVMLFGGGLPRRGDYVLFNVANGSILDMPSWTIYLPEGWSADGVVVRGQQVVLTDLNPVPEPSTFALLGMGILGFLVYVWQRRETA